MNDKAIKKEIQYYGYFVLISNEKMDALSALRECRFREKTEECFRLAKQYNDTHVTRSKSTASLEGRFSSENMIMEIVEVLKNKALEFPRAHEITRSKLL